MTFAYDRYITDRTSTAGKGSAFGHNRSDAEWKMDEALKDVWKDNPSNTPKFNGDVPSILGNNYTAPTWDSGAVWDKPGGKMINQPFGEPGLTSQALKGQSDFNPSADRPGGGGSIDIADLNAAQLAARSSGTNSQ